MHPLLYEFLHHVKDENGESIRVHCVNDEQRSVLQQFAEECFSDFNHISHVNTNGKFPEYVYYVFMPHVNYVATEFSGFDAYCVPNGRTYEFDDFIRIITPDGIAETKDDFGNLEELP